MPSEVRERILDTASRLFYQEGFRAVGIDRVVAESGVAKMSLYHHFGSKDDLVVEHLKRRQDLWTQWFHEAMEQRLEDGRGHVAAFFDALAEWINLQNQRGCPFINATLELVDYNHPARRVVDQHRAFVREFLSQQLEADGVRPTETLLSQLNLLIDGAIIGSVMGNGAAIRQAGAIAGQIVRHQCGLSRPVGDSVSPDYERWG